MSESMKVDVTVTDPKTGRQVVTTKIDLAEKAAIDFIDQLSDSDFVKVILFSDTVDPIDIKMDRMNDEGKRELKRQLKNLKDGAGGATALYDALDHAFTYLDNRPTDRNRGVVLLSDGKNTVLRAPKPGEENLNRDQRMAKRRQEVIEQVRNDGERNIFIFTIGYGDPKNQKDLDEPTLKEVSKVTQGRYDPANSNTINKILREIVTFF